MANVLITPRKSAGSSVRKRMFISEQDAKKMRRGKSWEANITDVNTDKKYKIIGCACSCPTCFCDAFIAKDKT